MRLLPGAGHYCFLDYPGGFNAAVREVTAQVAAEAEQLGEGECKWRQAKVGGEGRYRLF